MVNTPYLTTYQVIKSDLLITFIGFNVYDIGKFQIIDQSASPVYLQTTSVPIFCIVSDHSIDDKYEWDRMDRILPGNDVG